MPLNCGLLKFYKCVHKHLTVRSLKKKETTIVILKDEIREVIESGISKNNESKIDDFDSIYDMSYVESSMNNHDYKVRKYDKRHSRVYILASYLDEYDVDSFYGRNVINIGEYCSITTDQCISDFKESLKDNQHKRYLFTQLSYTCDFGFDFFRTTKQTEIITIYSKYIRKTGNIHKRANDSNP